MSLPPLKQTTKLPNIKSACSSPASAKLLASNTSSSVSKSVDAGVVKLSSDSLRSKGASKAAAVAIEQHHHQQQLISAIGGANAIEKRKQRERAEAYAINAVLKKAEQRHFEEVLKKNRGRQYLESLEGDSDNSNDESEKPPEPTLEKMRAAASSMKQSCGGGSNSRVGKKIASAGGV